MRSVGRLVLALVVALTGVLVGTATTPATAAYSQAPGRSWVPNDTVWDIARAGSTIYIAGDFTSLRNPTTGATVSRNRVAALDAATGEPLPWNPGANGTVRAIDAAAGRVFFGGTFSQAGGQPATRIAAVDTAGAPLPGWDASTNSTVWRIVATADSVYIGGLFTSVSGVGRPRLARLDPATGAVVRGFNARVTGGRVTAIAPAPGGATLYIGGLFTGLAGSPRGFVGEVNATTGAATSWTPEARCEDCYLFDLAAEGDRVFGAIGGGGGRVVAWSAQNGNAAWQRRGDGDVQAIDVEAGVVYAGGHFGPEFDGQPRHQLAALQASNGALLSYRPPFTGGDFPGVWAVLADTTGLHLGGASRYSGSNARRYARFGYIIEPPSAPRNVSATVTRTSVQVRWAAPASSGGGLDRYQVFVNPLGNFSDDRVCVTRRRTCTVPIGRSGLVEGESYRFTVRGVNSSGAGPSSDPSDSVVADGRGPGVIVAGRAWRTVTGGSAGLSWTANDPSGVDGYRVAQHTGTPRKGFSAWTVSTTSSSTTTLSLSPGSTACAKVRGVDGRGNLGPWSRVVCRTAPVDDSGLRAKGSVRRVKGAGYFLGTASRISGPTGSLSMPRSRITGASLAARSCPSCGKVRVYYGKQLVRTVNLRSAATRQKVVTLPAPGRPGKRGMTVTLRPAGKGPVFIDGLALRPR